MKRLFHVLIGQYSVCFTRSLLIAFSVALVIRTATPEL